MSHLRNLLYNAPAQEQTATRVSPVPVLETSGGPSAVAFAPAEPRVAPVTTPPVTAPQFPVEEAHLSPESRVVYHLDAHSPAADRYRLLRMRLKEQWRKGKLKKLLVTSPLAHDGKSTVLVNLATALAERGKRNVLVVEADLHHPFFTPTLNLKRSTGLSDCLSDEEISPLSVVRRIEPLGWCFLGAGEPRKNPTELLQAPAFGHIIQKLLPCFDWILIDSPPVIALTDPLSLQQHTDGTLLVVRAEQTPREAIEQTIALVGEKNIVGMVLNGVSARDHMYYKYYGYGSRHER